MRSFARAALAELLIGPNGVLGIGIDSNYLYRSTLPPFLLESIFTV